MDNVNKLGKQERTYQVAGRQSGQPKVCRHFHIYKDQRISHLASIHRTRVENKGIDATKILSWPSLVVEQDQDRHRETQHLCKAPS